MGKNKRGKRGKKSNRHREATKCNRVCCTCGDEFYQSDYDEETEELDYEEKLLKDCRKRADRKDADDYEQLLAQAYAFIKTEKQKTPPVKALLRGLPWLCDEVGIRYWLHWSGFGYVEVKLHSPQNRKKPPLYVLSVHTGENKLRRKEPEKIFELTYLYGFQVTVEPLPEGFERKPQCFKCQQEGHVAKHCRNAPACVKCAGAHDSRSCPLREGGRPRCVRCGGPHVASWRGCPAFCSEQKPAGSSQDEQGEQPQEVAICDGGSKKRRRADALPAQEQANSTAEQHRGDTVQENDCEEDNTKQEGAAVDGGSKKRRRRRRGKRADALQANEEPVEQSDPVGQQRRGTAGQLDGRAVPQEEITEQASGACDADSKKRRGKPAEDVPAQDAATPEPAQQVNSSEQTQGETADVRAEKKRRRRRRGKRTGDLPPEAGVPAAAATPSQDTPASGSGAAPEEVAARGEQADVQQDGCEVPQEENRGQESAACDADSKKRRGKPADDVPAQDAATPEPAQQVNSSEQTQGETADVGAEKKRRRRRRGKPAGDLPPEAAAAPTQDMPASGSGAAAEEVAAQADVQQLAAEVARLLTERLRGTVLETVQAALSAHQ